MTMMTYHSNKTMSKGMGIMALFAKPADEPKVCEFFDTDLETMVMCLRRYEKAPGISQPEYYELLHLKNTIAAVTLNPDGVYYLTLMKKQVDVLQKAARYVVKHQAVTECEQWKSVANVLVEIAK